jgi:hypothetical protein
VLQAESESGAQRTATAVPSSALAVPASLHASLMGRLDRLGPAKEIAQIGQRAMAAEVPTDRSATTTKSLELRAAMSMARLWRDQGNETKRANCLLRFTAGSPKGSTRAT